MKLKKIPQTLFAIGVLSSFAFSSYAQETVQRVEITGSSIKRTAIETNAAVQTLTREDIERTGASTALGVLTDTVAVSTDINSANSSAGSFATGSSGISMRGFSKVSTLVLVNGRRIAPYGLADGAQENFTNLDAIAADAIDRIEILKDGASAIYGSDAIAGVVNIILRKNYQGAQIKAGYRVAENFSDNRSRNVSAIYGFGDVETNGFNTYITVDAYKRDGYTTSDLKPQYPEWHRATPGRSTWDAKSSYSPTGNYFINSTNIVAAPGCPAESIDPVTKLCMYDILKFDGQTTNSERFAVASNTNFRIGNNINANFEATYAKAKNSYIVAPFNTPATSGSSIWYNVNQGKMVGPFSYPKLPVGHPYNPYNSPTEIRARLADTGNGFNFNSTDSEQYRLMLALDGTIGKYDWKSAFGHMSSNADKGTRSTSAAGYTNAIVNGTYKFGQVNDRALLESMFPVRKTSGESNITFFDATLTGELMQLPAGPAMFAIGGDIRRDAYEMSSSNNVLNGELVSVFGLQVKDARNQYALFTEATIPVVKKLEVTAALRADQTSGFDAHVSPKIGFRLDATDSLLLRGTASGGFRAPNIVESGDGRGRSSVSTNNNDLRRCPIATELNNLVQNSASATNTDKALANGYRANDCSLGLPSFVASNPDLKPETSRSYTLGLVFAPTKQWSVAMDYYNIERKDEIGTRAISDILRGEASLPAGQLVRLDNSATDKDFLALVNKYAPGNTLNFNNIGKLGLVYNPYVNTGKTRVSGVDFDISSRFKIANVGTLRMQLEGNYVLKYQEYSQTDSKWGPDQMGTYDGGSRMVLKLVTELKTGNWKNSIIVDQRTPYSTNSIGSPTYCVTNKVSPENMSACAEVDQPTFVNYSVTYSGIKNTSLNLYVGNLFQTDNGQNWRGGWSPNFRTFYVNGTYKFK